jgi:glyoxylase-like metal-dependent hydrolase (beta-lactamase superfamily II)
MTSTPVGIQVGDVRVVALDDGRYPVDMTELAGIGRDDAIRLTCACGLDCSALPVNAFLLQLPHGNVLVDAGAGSQAGSSLGHMAANLAVLDIEPGAIAHVLLTHLHLDHVAGLLATDGSAQFPNAEICLHEKEAAFWLDGDIDAKWTERTQRNAAKARAALAPYHGRILRVMTGEVLPGIAIVSLPGHTPGHTGWLLRSNEESMLFWGDTVHFTAVQLAHPDASVKFDVDGNAATQTRRQLFALVAAGGIAVAGAHLPYPGFGYVSYQGERYTFTSRYQQELTSNRDAHGNGKR